MKQLQKNFIFNLLSIISNTIIGFLYTPYLIKTLGVATYGILPLTLLINQYISVLTASLSGALTRFYTIALQQHDYKRASKCLSTVIGVFLLLIFILIPFVALFIFKLDHFFDLPHELIVSSKLLFVFTVSSLFVSLFSSSLNVTLYAENRLDLLNCIKMLRVGMKFLFAIFFFELIGKEVYYIGLGNLFSELIVLGISYYWYIVSKNERVCIKYCYFDKSLLLTIAGMAIWTIIHQMGDVGIYRVDNIIVNNTFGISYSGALGAISEFGVYVGLFVSVIGSLYGPTILKAYAKGEHMEVQQLVLNSSVIVGAISAIFCGLLMGTSKKLLSYWLGDSFSIYGEWLILKLLPLPFYAAAGVFAFSNRAWNVVRKPAILTVLFGILNCCALLIIASFTNDLGYNVLYSVSFMLSFAALLTVGQSFILNASFFCQQYLYNRKRVMIVFFKIVLIFIISFLLVIVLIHLWPPMNLVQLIITYVCGTILLLSVMYCLILNREQKKMFLALIKK